MHHPWNNRNRRLAYRRTTLLEFQSHEQGLARLKRAISSLAVMQASARIGRGFNNATGAITTLD